jgi:catechol 2,3-dioxygenase-like lactoylglutathione lyase family enzyme
MLFYMCELGVTDMSAAVGWWSNLLSAEPAMRDDANGFVLFAPSGGRVALKRGGTNRGTVHFQVSDLLGELHRLFTSSEVKQSDEGYRRAKLHDPDGNVVVLFEWG